MEMWVIFFHVWHIYLCYWDFIKINLFSRMLQLVFLCSNLIAPPTGAWREREREHFFLISSHRRRRSKHQSWWLKQIPLPNWACAKYFTTGLNFILHPLPFTLSSFCVKASKIYFHRWWKLVVTFFLSLSIYSSLLTSIPLVQIIGKR